MSLRPNTTLVTLGWLSDLFDYPNGRDLPEDNTLWAASGFVQVLPTGGAVNPHFPLREAVVSIDCWAVDPDGEFPPWNKADQLAEQIIAATYDQTSKRQVVVGGTYTNAHVQSIYPLTEPRPAPSDVAGYAHTQFDLAVDWVAAASS